MWEVEFHEKAREEYDKLPISFRDEFDYLFNRIELGGVLPLSAKQSKHVEDGIWELRATVKEGTARSLYVTREGRSIKVLVVFVKKTQKTPRAKIELAKKRRLE